jgi:CheY-like chemotaxis protein
VTAASEGEGRGATFTASLPLAAGPPESAPAPWWQDLGAAAREVAPVDLEGVSVLVVDDEPDALELVRHLLSRCRAEVQLAASAAEALLQLDRRLPTVLVSDIGMPDEDGYSLIRRMRERSPDRGGRVPALALTAFAHDEDRTRALRAGYQAHLPKPFQPRDLLHQIAILSGRGPRAR